MHGHGQHEISTKSKPTLTVKPLSCRHSYVSPVDILGVKHGADPLYPQYARQLRIYIVAVWSNMLLFRVP